ncbi:MAG: hypothetical protein FGM54_00895 [Chitinophagaceae bacterium]|nr:hypothetical protein [Chitinophagaceae bacterium]
MFPVFESIAIQDGVYLNIASHMARIQYTAQSLWHLALPANYLQERLPAFHEPGLFKCRFQYNSETFNLEIKPYERRRIQHLILKEMPDLYYAFKYTHRMALDHWQLELPTHTDVLFTRRGFLTDTSYCNIALMREGIWYTPQEPLLPGTQRAFGLKTGQLHATPISVQDISSYECITLFNAMIPIGELVLPISAIQ